MQSLFFTKEIIQERVLGVFPVKTIEKRLNTRV